MSYAETDPVIQVRDLVKEFDGRRVLNRISFCVHPGERLAILGPSGGGKSTLLSCLIGATIPEEGEIRLLGEVLRPKDRKAMDRLRLKFGVMFQGGALFSSMSIHDNVALPIRRHSGLADETIDILVGMKLNQVGLFAASERFPDELSGGMIKRAALARAMALDPALVFIDEPSAGLDPVTVAGIDDLLLKQATTHDVTMLVVTHDMQSAYRIASRLIMLYKGEILFDGSPQEIRECEDPVVRQFVEGRKDGPLGFQESTMDFRKLLLEGD
ncbi:MAG TPA: ATP-binding cassette domain-containing protein [Planctomycetes bacterium]|nr:ATP-binding cassette domain-containing protein [Planctomycetota bacterium]